MLMQIKYEESHVSWHYLWYVIIGENQTIDQLIKKNELIFKKLNYIIWMKILNEIACTLNLISI